MAEKFGAVLVGGLAIFGLVFILNQGVGFDFSSSNPERMVFADRSFGKVGQSNPDFRTISLGSFAVGEARGDITAYSSETAEISDTLLRSNTLNFKYNATQPRKGKVTFEVLGRDGRGSVYVKVNGKTIYSEYLVSTATPSIEIPADALKPGMNNFVIGVNRQGFFSSSVYSLEDVEVTVDDRKFHDVTESFQLYQYELEDYLESTLSFSIVESVKTSPLKIFVNENLLYSKEQVRVSSEQVNITPREADLHPGLNTITFKTDGEAKYVLSNTQVTMRYLGAVSSQRVKLGFKMNDSQLGFAKRDDTTEYVSFKYQTLLPSKRDLEVKLNEETFNISPQNGLNKFNVSADMLQEDNSIEVESSGTYTLDDLRVYSVRGE